MGCNQAIRAVIMAIVGVVFCGYIFLWIMTPTNLYKTKWLPNILAKTNSTYFGSQGTAILLYTYPVIFIAVLGCIYNHIVKKSNQNNIKSYNNKHCSASWKRPRIIKVLGIVSWIELVFFAMFITLLVWSFSTYLHIGFGKIIPKSAATATEQVWEAKLKSVAKMGLVGNIVLAFLFFPVARGSSVLPLLGLTSEASVKYHIWLGHIVMTLFTGHSVCFIIYWVITNNLSEMLKWGKIGVSNVAGEIAMICGLVMWVTTIPKIRRKMFELFFYTHYLYILFVVFYVFHVGIRYASLMLPGFYLFVVDRYLRFLQSRKHVRLLSARVLPCEAVELNFTKSRALSYNPTSTIFLNIPSISKMQWHPFTVTSSSNLEPEKLSVIIKAQGNWSTKLYHSLSSPSPIDRLVASIEGPYGPLSTDFLRHDTLVMVSGGSGLTPFISIIRELIFMSETQKCKTPQILLISSFKYSSDLTLLDLLLPISINTPFDFSNFNVQIEAYVTREKHPPTQNQNPILPIWFKTNSSDSPITPTLGPNSWIWLGAIISSSFLIFLFLMGILTHYYLHPTERNTNNIFSSSSISVLNMLIICISIAITASGAFLWNKKQNVMGNNQIQSMEGITRELESYPQESITQSTKVHYGERPDLSKILFELKETSVGVLVCGPKKMRHEVADICSSSLAHNLHFESISFSW